MANAVMGWIFQLIAELHFLNRKTRRNRGGARRESRGENGRESTVNKIRHRRPRPARHG